MSLVLVVQGRNTKNAVGENNTLRGAADGKIYTTEDGLAKIY